MSSQVVQKAPHVLDNESLMYHHLDSCPRADTSRRHGKCNCMPQKVCDYCGESYVPERQRANGRFCCTAHKKMFRVRLISQQKARARAGKKCEKCGEEFQPARADQKYCKGKYCRERAGYARNASHRRAYARSRYHEDPDKFRARQRTYRQQDPERYRERDRARFPARRSKKLAQRAQELEQLAAAQRILAAASTKVPKKRGRRKQHDEDKSFFLIGPEVLRAAEQLQPAVALKANRRQLLQSGYSSEQINVVLQSKTALSAAIRFVARVRRMSEKSVKTYYARYTAYMKKKTNASD